MLVHLHLGSGYKPRDQCKCDSTREQWTAFWATVDDISVSDWQPRYVDDSVMDGPGWSVTLELGERRIQSGGENAFPTDFRAWCDAVSALGDGEPFR